MKSPSILFAGLLSLVVLGGCDNITGLDNRGAPTSVLSGRVVYDGQPVGVRSTGVQLELWQPAYALNQKIPVNVNQDGTFRATLFDGSYKLNLLANNGPWVNSSDTTLITLNGEATVDIPVTPYYTLQNASYSRGAPTTAVPGGAVTATFNIGKINTTRALEFVGLYVGVTSFVDRTNSVVTTNNAHRERTLAQIRPQYDSNGNITITVNLPATIYQTQSPVVRDFIFVRVGVKAVGVTEMLFSPVQELAL